MVIDLTKWGVKFIRSDDHGLFLKLIRNKVSAIFLPYDSVYLDSSTNWSSRDS